MLTLFNNAPNILQGLQYSTYRRQAQMHFAIYCNNQCPALIIAKTMNTDEQI